MAVNLTGHRRLDTAQCVMSAITSGDCWAVRAPGRAGSVRRVALEPIWRRAPTPFPVVEPAPAIGESQRLPRQRAGARRAVRRAGPREPRALANARTRAR